jgi:hypothetical protein
MEVESKFVHCPQTGAHWNFIDHPVGYVRKVLRLSKWTGLSIMEIEMAVKVAQFGECEFDWSPERELRMLYREAESDAELLAQGNASFADIIAIWRRGCAARRIRVGLGLEKPDPEQDAAEERIRNLARRLIRRGQYIDDGLPDESLERQLSKIRHETEKDIECMERSEIILLSSLEIAAKKHVVRTRFLVRHGQSPLSVHVAAKEQLKSIQKLMKEGW